MKSYMFINIQKKKHPGVCSLKVNLFLSNAAAFLDVSITERLRRHGVKTGLTE